MYWRIRSTERIGVDETGYREGIKMSRETRGGRRRVESSHDNHGRVVHDDHPFLNAIRELECDGDNDNEITSRMNRGPSRIKPLEIGEEVGRDLVTAA